MGGDISIGAVGAALIAGIISLLGLIISKEQKTSEFRQTWVDSLRSEITNYLTSFNAISDALLVNYVTQIDKITALSPLYSKFNESSYAITLRLNPDEDRSNSVLACMKRFNQLATNEADMTPTKIKPIEIDFLSASKKLLKYEWKRVKRGEPTFLATKVIAALVIIAALLALPFLKSGKGSAVDESAKATSPRVINNVRTEILQSLTSATACPLPANSQSKDSKLVRGHISNATTRASSRRLRAAACERQGDTCLD